MTPPVSKDISEKEKIIGQILAAQNILHVLPTQKKLGEFVSEVVRSIPGVKSVGLCLSGYSKTMSDLEEGCQDCLFSKSLTSVRLDFRCGLSEIENLWALSLKTTFRLYGFLQIRDDGSSKLENYKPILINFANIVTMTLENQWHRENLEATNAELQYHRNNLKFLIEERTKKIYAQKEQLKNYAAELESANEEMRDFIHIASHDLREPLRKIVTFADLLDSRSHSFKGNEKLYLKRMINASTRMQELLNGLREYSNLDSLQKSSFESVNLEEIVKQVWSDLETQVQETGGKIEVGSLPSLPANRFLITVLFQNLIANSLKYRRKNISPLIKIQDRPSSPQVGSCEIRVEDNGIGFDEKYNEQIFKPFKRLHGKNEYAGTGIGLAICKKIVVNHAGSIDVKSKVNEGTIFIINLPLKQPAR